VAASYSDIVHPKDRYEMGGSSTSSGWNGIWANRAARRLWSVPDPHLCSVVEHWRATGGQSRRAERGAPRLALDVGCGPGRHARLLARAGFRVFAVDPSPRAAAECAAGLLEDGRSATVLCGDPCRLPVTGSLFDVVVAFNSIYHGTKRQVSATVRSLHSALRPGGRVFATFPSHSHRMYGKGEQVEPDTFRSEGFLPELFPEAGERGVLHHFCSEATLRKLFDGFTIDRLELAELELPFERQGFERQSELRWLRVRGADFWRLEAVRE
jgi:SAM-dependent methyltransferase